MDARRVRDSAALLESVRAEASAPGALLVVVKSRNRSVAIFPEDIVGKADDELLAFIAMRLSDN